MPRWDKFFSGMAEGIPQGYRMGLAYQEEQRAKAQDTRAAAKHEKELRGMEQDYQYKEKINPLTLEAVGLQNRGLKSDVEIKEKFGAKQAQQGLDIGEQNLKDAKYNYSRKATEDKRLDAGVTGKNNMFYISQGHYNLSPEAIAAMPENIQPFFNGEARRMFGQQAMELQKAKAAGVSPEVFQEMDADYQDNRVRFFDQSAEGLKEGARQLKKVPPNAVTPLQARTVETHLENLSAAFADQGIAFDAEFDRQTGRMMVTQYESRSGDKRPRVTRKFFVSLDELISGDLVGNLKTDKVLNKSRTDAEAEKLAAELAVEEKLAKIAEMRAGASSKGTANRRDSEKSMNDFVKTLSELQSIQPEYIDRIKTEGARDPSFLNKINAIIQQGVSPIEAVDGVLKAKHYGGAVTVVDGEVMIGGKPARTLELQ